MKATLEFDLTDDMDKYDFDLFKRARNLDGFVDSFREYLRQQYKYGEYDEKEMAVIEKIREKFFELSNEYGD